MNEKTIKGSEETSKLQERLRKQRPMFLKMAERIRFKQIRIPRRKILIERFKIKGYEADYIMTKDVFRKIDNGFVWDMCRESKK